ncbi:MAG: hypothetical protein C4320_06855 [Armatimonadota bacterium]
MEDQIQEHQEVVGSDGQHVGIVDHVSEGQIKLTRNDSPDGKHHLLSTEHIGFVDDKVRLKVTAAEAMAASTVA